MFLRCGHLIFYHSFLHASMHTYVKCNLTEKNRFLLLQNAAQIGSVSLFEPPIASLFQDSEGTSTSTETNNTSYESPNSQLFGA
jgi:hypothetical protein